MFVILSLNVFTGEAALILVQCRHVPPALCSCPYPPLIHYVLGSPPQPFCFCLPVAGGRERGGEGQEGTSMGEGQGQEET